ncbi:hypothetical protein CLV36_105197 [Laceyella sediminis]|uniref:Uncharacterized protein n=1 Tax=Laceyella sediminis TaxID=573074 RepID=A0ABX5EPN9_9BACL|nr:hypothetical protein [Laceyella sediminis]PRZ14881.1 hypothetical protein CLV36_105197 [Laceyella sediminis]
MIIGEDLFLQQVNRELERIEAQLNQEGEKPKWLTLQRQKIALNLICHQLKQIDPNVGESSEKPDAGQVRRNLYYFKAQMLLRQIEERKKS